jgi:hypothetical protein
MITLQKERGNPLKTSFCFQTADVKSLCTKRKKDYMLEYKLSTCLPVGIEIVPP